MIRHAVLRLARWLVVAYAVAQLVLSAAGIALFPRYAETHLDSDELTPNTAWKAADVQAALEDLGWPATTMAWIVLSRELVSTLLIYPVLYLLLSRKANSGFGVYVALVFALGPSGFIALRPLYDYVPGLAAAGNVVGATSWQLFFILFYFFPDGRPVPRWTRWLACAWGGFVALNVVAYSQVARFFGPNASASPLFGQVTLWVFVGLVFVAVASQVYRYFFRSDAVQRQQTKTVVFVLALAAVVFAVGVPISFRPPNSAQLGLDLIVVTALWYVFALFFALIPATIGLAVLRYRLWDIDVIIRRTLVYSVLTGLLALAYFGSVVVLQNTFGALTGHQQSTLVTVLSTLVIAALFVPLRRRVQAVIDRRLYRRKYDAARILAAFGTSARDDVDLDDLTQRLLGVVDETMQPASVGLWLRVPADSATRTGST
jgi:hypothetical protein